MDYSKNWDKLENNSGYFEEADIYLQDRQRLLKILASFVNYFAGQKPLKILDLGCGDGVLSKYLLQNNVEANFVCCDGSASVLEKAKQNLGDCRAVTYMQLTFEELVERVTQGSIYDFIISAFAIHHVELDKKYSFFEKLYSLLKPGGYFINIDTCITQNNTLNSWYYQLWKEWILEYQQKYGVAKDFSKVPEKAPHKPENHYQDLNEQLNWLKGLGFINVECFYRYGIFAIYGGQR